MDTGEDFQGGKERKLGEEVIGGVEGDGWDEGEVLGVSAE